MCCKLKLEKVVVLTIVIFFCFCSFDDEIWDVWFNFIGEDNYERQIGECDITFSHLVAIKEEQGYDGSYSMYYPKVLGAGMQGWT